MSRRRSHAQQTEDYIRDFVEPHEWQFKARFPEVDIEAFWGKARALGGDGDCIYSRIRSILERHDTRPLDEYGGGRGFDPTHFWKTWDRLLEEGKATPGDVLPRSQG